MIETIFYIALVYGLLSAIVFHIEIMDYVHPLIALAFKPGTDAIFWVSYYYFNLRYGNGKKV